LKITALHAYAAACECGKNTLSGFCLKKKKNLKKRKQDTGKVTRAEFTMNGSGCFSLSGGRKKLIAQK
jgi:4-diphosphocytidyl-2C-methyl-D-erythritol kinase